jgi:hypothetical protein
LSAFAPIAPRAAATIAEEAELGEVGRVLLDFAAAGLLKGYARLIETVDARGDRSEVRDSRISREIWRRIAEEGRGGDVWSSGTVRLSGSGLVGGADAVAIIGIRFDEKSLKAVVEQHRPTRSAAKRVVIRAARPVIAESASDDIVVVAKPHSVAPAPVPLPDGAISVSVAQACAALGLGRTKVNAMMKAGELVRVKIGGRALITIASIRALLPADTN